MTQRLPCPPAPGPLEEYAAHFDDLFETLAQRRSFRAYLQGLLLPRERNKTLTALAGAEPIVEAQHPEVQRLQFFLSESPWDAEALNARRLEVLLADPSTRPQADGVLIIDETGDRKDGTKTAHVARQYLGSRGKIENGIVAVTSLWADERLYYPLHLQPYTPSERLVGGKKDPAFRTKPQLGLALVAAAVEAGISFRAVVADCFYGDNLGFTRTLEGAGLPYVVGVKKSTGIWAAADAIHSPQEAVAALRWESPDQPGEWTPIVRSFRDGHTETWWAVDLVYGPYGPQQARRMVVATIDPQTLPDLSTWYLTTNLPHPQRADLANVPFAPAGLAEVVRLYGLRQWVEQSYRQVKHELGWADFMVRADQAIRRHWHLVCCAFAFCWRQWFTSADPTPSDDAVERGENPPFALLAPGDPSGPRLARSVELPLALLAGVVGSASAPGAPSTTPLGWQRPSAHPLSP
jgi:hypothetical protein